MRTLLCGLLVGGIWTLLSVVVLFVVGDAFLAALPRGGPTGRGIDLFLLAMNVAGGIWAMWLYAALRPRYGAGWRTAFIAGLAWWIIVSLQSAKWAAIVAVPPAAALAPAAGTLLAILTSIMVGAWAYER